MKNVATYTDEKPRDAPIRPNLGMRIMDTATLESNAAALEYMKRWVFLTEAMAWVRMFAEMKSAENPIIIDSALAMQHHIN